MSSYEREALKNMQSQKPNLTSKQHEILGAFYRLDRERDRVGQMASPQHIKQKSVREYIEFNGSHGYEPDIFIDIILQIDDKYLVMFFEKQAREAKRHGR